MSTKSDEQVTLTHHLALAQMSQSLRLQDQGKHEEAAELRYKAMLSLRRAAILARERALEVLPDNPPLP